MPESQDHIRLAISLRDGSLDKSVLFSLSQITSLPQDVTSVPRSSDLLTDAELQLTEEYDATALLEMLAAKKVTAVELLSAFRKRATIAQQCLSILSRSGCSEAHHHQTNCLTELLPEAIYDAEACDEHLALTGRLIGPLHGIPLSLKNQIGVASHLTNAGFLDETRPLKIGLLMDDGVVSPLPPVRTAMRRITEKLGRAIDVQVVTFSPMEHARGWSIIAANYFEDGGANIRAICEKGGEPVLPLTEWIINECQKGRAEVASSPEGLKEARDAFRERYSDHWNQFDVDVVLAPIYPSVAGPHGATRYWGYTAIWNLLQYPAVAMPANKLVGAATAAELREAYEPKNELEKHYWEIYSPEDAEGLPIGVQVVGKRYHERLVLQAARVIEKALLGK
ncbi:amidase signature enzyme [Trichoderma longibrachiatum ATCC 18648]|uniref:Amidase signature enzyme n=1 Tax=Trichoderma longibrachiatum ATCC 18648 TaxID=983965 RepID=A0A2T4CEA0_TRILO|nr:amidase signature enzyme [Trichoderma longibrachiatum ATCC 18648]